MSVLSLTIQPDFEKEETRIFAIYHFSGQGLLLPVSALPVYARNQIVHKIYVNNSEVHTRHIHSMYWADQQFEDAPSDLLEAQNRTWTQMAMREKTGDFYIDLRSLTQKQELNDSIYSVSFLVTVKNSPSLVYKQHPNLTSIFGAKPVKTLQILCKGDASEYLPVPLFFMNEKMQISSQFKLPNGYQVIASGQRLDQFSFQNAHCQVHRYHFQVDQYVTIGNCRISQDHRLINFEVIRYLTYQCLDNIQDNFQLTGLNTRPTLVFNPNQDHAEPWADVIVYPLYEIQDCQHVCDMEAQALYQYVSLAAADYCVAQINATTQQGLSALQVVKYLLKCHLDRQYLQESLIKY